MKKDISTKIISLLFAIFLWFYIIQVQSPEIEKSVKDVPVQFTKSELEARGLTLMNDKEVEISIKIKGQRKYITGIKKEDITVVADVSKIGSTGTHKVSTKVVLPYGNLEVVEQEPSFISVTVEEIVEEEKELKFNIIGEPAEGYCVGDIKTTPEKIKVKGPKPIVSSIENLVADVDVDGKSEDISTVEDIYIMGTSGTALNNPYVTFEDSSADIHCAILKMKTVDIEVKFAHGVDGYVLDDNSVKSIEVAGSVAAIEELAKVATSEITADKISADGEVEIGLILPDGIKSLDGNNVTLRLKKQS